MSFDIRMRAGIALAALVWLAGCATPARTLAPGTGWSGRMALQVEGSASQSFTASFELQGSAQTGVLTLFTPLGGTAGRIEWKPGEATLDTGGNKQQFASLDALSAETTGSPIPVAALFDWLAGVATQVPGWQADLSRASEGRISARRTAPPPLADLRVVLER